MKKQIILLVVLFIGCLGISQTDKVITIEVTEPAEKITFTLEELNNPSGSGFTNGSIVVDVDGGTPFAGGSYTFEWRDSGNNLVTTTSTQNVASGFRITLSNLAADTYTLTVTDANYIIATDTAGCTFFESYILVDPPPLSLNIQETKPISCNSGNIYADPANDGALTAVASGGVPFSPLIDGFYSYIYTWKKKDSSGIWQIIPGETIDVLNDVDAGEYAVNIEDANGIIVGTYAGNVLITANDELYTLDEPDLLEMALSSTEITCGAGNDGSASVLVWGGTGSYNVQWSNGETTPTIGNLVAGTYLAYVTDAKGCKATGQVIVNQPADLDIAIINQTNPNCYLGTDGSISVGISGGQSPFTYLWNTGDNTETLSNLTSGVYTLQITDANNCTAFRDIELFDPEPVEVDLGENRTLCNDQTHQIDITVNDNAASYLWTSNNGFSSTSPVVTLSEAGTYTATLTTGLGCTGSDTVEIVTRTGVVVDSQFIVTSQAFAMEQIILINTSNPLSDVVDWIVPAEAQIIEETNETITLRFDAPGAYEVTLRSFEGGCYKDDTNPIIVEAARTLPDVGDADEPFIKEFIVFPNPASGAFTVAINLDKEASVSLRLYNLTSNVPFDDKQLKGRKNYEQSYSLNLPSGAYFLLLETAKESQIRKIIIR